MKSSVDFKSVAENNIKLAKSKAATAGKLYGDPDSARDFGMIVGMSAELALKAIISASKHDYKKIHDLTALLKQAETCSSKDLSEFKVLLDSSDFIVMSRYEFDGDWEIKNADEVLDALMRLIRLGEQMISKMV